MSTYRLHLMVVSDQDVLDQGGETYADLWRNLALPVQPYMGMSVILSPSNLAENGERWQRLRSTLENPYDGYQIQDISVVVGGMSDKDPDHVTAYLKLGEIYEPTLARFRARIHYLEQFYGFERS
jgi:hypothetical protein